MTDGPTASVTLDHVGRRASERSPECFWTLLTSLQSTCRPTALFEKLSKEIEKPFCNGFHKRAGRSGRRQSEEGGVERRQELGPASGRRSHGGHAQLGQKRCRDPAPHKKGPRGPGQAGAFRLETYASEPRRLRSFSSPPDAARASSPSASATPLAPPLPVGGRDGVASVRAANGGARGDPHKS
ncbi:uncharacterized protein LOC127593467 isoform X3 [Hippocampus zosterae]|uniref:uncharacterized protein LOC127593467 isoform X3 n=1 Tax=Hippocampus zosterae TaxID=109293 RepID=UPI00223E8B2E|nr:uncharacterized protein LOC127593467 isoform X3 [Hippocampus zosterae]